MAWEVVTEAQGKNPGVLKRAAQNVGLSQPENIGGIVIYLANGSARTEFTRVAFVRRPEVCKNPERTFKEQLAVEMKKAQDACKALNDVGGNAGELQ